MEKLFLAVLFLAGCGASQGEKRPASKPKPHVPDGFMIEQVAGEKEIVFPMFATFDDRGRLFVTESSGQDLYDELKRGVRGCRVRRLEDRDGDGRFETSRVFADKLVPSMGLVWRDGKLYVADPPDLVVFEDKDDDGRADRRTVILTGFGHTDNGSLHGLTFGPDGLLYMTMGEPDGYKLKRRDGTVLEGESGALIRCRPDGSDPEVLCRGFVNLVEVAFTPRGEAFGTDNFFQIPQDGIRDALVHLVEGGLYPYHPDKGTPQPITGEPLTPMTRLPTTAIGGLVLYRGQAFPPEMRGNLFSTQHNTRKVQRHVVEPDGSTFRARDIDFVTSDDPDFHPSDVLEDADGSLLVIDTGSWYRHHCPTGNIRDIHAPGGIYRVRRAGATPIRDPWGLKENWPRASEKRLAELFGDSRPMVRDRAQRTLVTRGKAAVPCLASVRDISALWTLEQIPGEASGALLRKALQDPAPDVVATAARTLGARRDRPAAPDLCRLLSNNTACVRMAAAEALAHCGSEDSLPSLWKALSGEPDRFLEHALIYAVHRIADRRALEARLDDPHPRIQKAALLLLDQPPREGLAPDPVIRRVTAADGGLRRTALYVLLKHPEWADPAIPLLRRWLEKPELTEEEESDLRSSILAFQSAPSVQELIGTVMEAGATSAERRVFLLETLSQSSLPELPSAWNGILERALRHSDRSVRLQAVRAAIMLQVFSLDDVLVQRAEDPKEAVDVRLEALRAVVSRRPRLSPPCVEFLTAQLGSQGDPLVPLAAAEVLGRSHRTDAEVLRALEAVRGNPLILPGVLLPALRESTDVTTAAALLDFLEKAVRDGWRGTDEELRAAIERLPEGVRARGEKVREIAKRGPDDQRARLAAAEPLLAGGDAKKGREVFFGKKATCSTCHAIGGEGGRIGPDLTKVGAVRSGRDILESVLFPSATFAQGYENYTVTMVDGAVHTGLVARQTGNVLVLRDSTGRETQLRKDRIRARIKRPVSIMPEGLERALTPDEFRDLLAFLQGLK